jgi:ATP-dependent DNA helicase RecQ
VIQAAERLLAEIWGHPSFRGSQQAAIERTLGGKSTLLIMPTGLGKSLCYQIPAMLLDGCCVVVSPLVALMKDQVDRLKALGIRAETINSSLSREAREAVQAKLGTDPPDLLYVTPERFRKPEFRELLTHLKVSLLAVDEAHCISEWGHDFRPDYTRMREIRGLLGNPPVIALTATATPAVQEDIRQQLGLEGKDFPVIHDGVERPNLALSVSDMHGEREKVKRIQLLLAGARGSAIIYFALIKTLGQFSLMLEKAGIRHIVYHGKLNAAERRRNQEAFMQGREALVLATNAFGLGVDKADIGLIVHAEAPGSLEAYAQEIGRAGRDGLPAHCELLYDQQDLLIQMEFVDWANPSPEFTERLFGLLKGRLREFQGRGGLEALREEMVFKTRGDFRLETALRLLERHGVLEGDLDEHNLRLKVNALPELLADPDWIESKKKRDLSRLHDLVRYAGEVSCRRSHLHAHFGFSDATPCGRCDLCLPGSTI